MKLTTLTPLAFVFALGAPASAETASESLIQMHSEPDEFYLFDQQDVQVLDYKTAREVRVCADQRQHMVPIRVTYDGKTTEVRPGDCTRVEAKTVTLAPADTLESSWDLSGTVE